MAKRRAAARRGKRNKLATAFIVVIVVLALVFCLGLLFKFSGWFPFGKEEVSNPSNVTEEPDNGNDTDTDNTNDYENDFGTSDFSGIELEEDVFIYLSDESSWSGTY